MAKAVDQSSNGGLLVCVRIPLPLTASPESLHFTIPWTLSGFPPSPCDDPATPGEKCCVRQAQTDQIVLKANGFWLNFPTWVLL